MKSKNSTDNSNKLKSPQEAWASPVFSFFKYGYYIYLIIALILSTFGLLFITHSNLQELNKHNIIFLLAGLLVAVIVWFVCKKLKIDKSGKTTSESKSHCVTMSKGDIKSQEKPKSKYKTFIIIASIILFAMMLFLCFGRLFVVGWDVWYLYFTNSDVNNYFSIYPNNLFLRGFHDLSLKIVVTPLCQLLASSIPTFDHILKNMSFDSVNYCLFIFVNIVCVFITILEITCIVKHTTTEKAAVLAFIVSSIFIGMMPWIAVPYSDITAMLFTTSLIAAYVCIKKPIVKTCLIVFLSIIGYYIKPTIIFVSAGILLIAIIWCWRKWKIEKFSIIKTTARTKQIVTNIISILITVAISFGIVIGITNCANVEIDEQKQFTSTHFLMMGLNPDKEGLWSQEDCDYSSNAANVEEREEKNIEKIVQRLTDMGPLGFIELMTKKTICNYADGNFSWELDAGPNFYISVFTHNPIIEYYNSHYKPVAQVFWFAILIAAIFSMFAIKRMSDKANSVVSIICFSLAAESAFLMLFECGARYLILYIPLIIILAVFGWTYYSPKKKYSLKKATSNKAKMKNQQ